MVALQTALNQLAKRQQTQLMAAERLLVSFYSQPMLHVSKLVIKPDGLGAVHRVVELVNRHQAVAMCFCLASYLVRFFEALIPVYLNLSTTV